MNKNPKITVVTACLNSEKTIRHTIESVLNQTYTNYEYIIKDGGSTDSTIRIVKEYEPLFEGKLRLIFQKDRCMYEAMNQGIDCAKGDIIGIINSDDYYSVDTLAHVAEIYANAETDLLVVIGDMERVSETGELIHRYHFTQELVDQKQCFGHPSMFASKAVYNKIGRYDTSYKLAADGDWQYRAMEDDAVQVLLCPHVFNHMREGGASDNPKYRWKWFKERSRMQLEHNRGTKLQIYCSEFWKVIKTDIKAIIPESLKEKAYKLRYR